MAHHAVQSNSVPEPGSILTGYMPNANPGEEITIISNTDSGRLISYGTVVEKDLPGYVAPVCGGDVRDLGEGHVRIQVDK